MKISRVSKANKLHPQTLEKHYKEILSDFREWESAVDADALVYPENFGEWMSIDETALYNGELYTVITNKDRQPSNRWSIGQRERADILFREYPQIKKAYDFSMFFRGIFENCSNEHRFSEVP